MYSTVIGVILFIVNNCCMRVLMYAKMQKEIKNEETRLF